MEGEFTKQRVILWERLVGSAIHNSYMAGILVLCTLAVPNLMPSPFDWVSDELDYTRISSSWLFVSYATLTTNLASEILYESAFMIPFLVCYLKPKYLLHNEW